MRKADDAAMAENTNQKSRLKRKKRPFATLQQEEKDHIMENRKAPNTQKATKLWMNAFNDYLEERSYPSADAIETKDLPVALMNFYTELRKTDSGEYKMSSLKSARAAINRYYREKRSIDLISDQRFITTNEMFKGVTRKAKQEGRGDTDSTPPIEPEDLTKLGEYFEANLNGPPHPAKLQEIVLFNIIYYMGRRGRQNLRAMTKNTFDIATDPDGKRYIYQKVKELDKNHTENDMEANQEARIYEKPGTFSQNMCTIPTHKIVSLYPKVTIKTIF